MHQNETLLAQAIWEGQYCDGVGLCAFTDHCQYADPGCVAVICDMAQLASVRKFWPGPVAIVDLCTNWPQGCSDRALEFCAMFRIDEIFWRLSKHLKLFRYFSWGHLRFSFDQKALYFEGVAIKIAGRELDILKIFLRFPNQCITPQLIRQELKFAILEDRVLAVYISRIRRALLNIPGINGSIIKTVRGLGYILEL